MIRNFRRAGGQSRPPLHRGKRRRSKGGNRARSDCAFPDGDVDVSQAELSNPDTTVDKIKDNDNSKNDPSEHAGSKALNEITVNQPGGSTAVPQITFGFFDDDDNKYNEEDPDEMSFAAKAREAEYNAAAAARLRARQLDGSTFGSGPSSLRPISLGAFTKPSATTRNKGHKGWKPLTAEDIEEKVSTPGSPRGDEIFSSPDDGVSLPGSSEYKGKQRDTSNSRPTHLMLPRLRTNLSPDAPKAELVGHIPPAASRGYNVPRDAAGRFLGYRVHPERPNWRDTMGFDPETGALVPNFFQNPVFLNADPLADFHDFYHSQNPDPHPSFLAANQQEQLLSGAHPDYSYFYPEELTSQYYPLNAVEDPFMGTPPRHGGSWGFNPYSQDYFGGHPYHPTNNYGRELAPSADMTMDTSYQRQFPRLSEPVPAQSSQLGQRPGPRRPVRPVSCLSSTTSSEENPAAFDRGRVTILRNGAIAPIFSDITENPRDRTSENEETANLESPLSVLVRGSTVDAAGRPFVPTASRQGGTIRPPPGFEKVRCPGAPSRLPNVEIRSTIVQSGDRLSRLGVLLPPASPGEPFRSRLPAANLETRNVEMFKIGEWETRRGFRPTAEEWFRVDNRGEKDLRDHVERLTLAASEQRQTDRAAAAEEFSMPATLAELVANSVEDTIADSSTILLGNALATLQEYVAGDRENQPFAPFGPPPEWAIDKSTGANLSFFEEDWGTPPRRVGRDLRYRPLPEDQLPTDEPVVVRGRRQY